MTRNRARTQHLAGAASGPTGRAIGALLTLALLAPATAVLAARTRAMARLDSSGGVPGCSGVDALGPALQAGLPAVGLVFAIPVALISLGHRARGWRWLLGALLGTLAVEVALRQLLPACL